MPIDVRFCGGIACVKDSTLAPNGEPLGMFEVVTLTVVPSTGRALAPSASPLLSVAAGEMKPLEQMCSVVVEPPGYGSANGSVTVVSESSVRASVTPVAGTKLFVPGLTT